MKLKGTMTMISFSVGEHDIAFLKRQWDKLVSLYPVEQSIKDNSFQILTEMYSEKDRFYHNLSHIKMLLNLLESIDDQIIDHHAIRFATWFHDAVYDTNRNDNEEESARLASEMLSKLQVDAGTIELVGRLILATKGHRGNSLTEATRLFLDMDLAILGMREEIYQQYSKAIRKEYSWVPEPAYRRDRRKILESFIDRESIYFTDEMKKRFEQQARRNMDAELKSFETE